MRLVIPILCLVIGSAGPVVQARSLHMGIPDFCAGSPDTVKSGQTLTLDGSQTKTRLGVHGVVIVTGALSVDTICVYDDGFLDVRSGASITYRNTPIDLARDPEQYGTGLLAFGKVRMTGSEKTGFVRLAVEALAGESTLHLSSTPIGWAVGDRLVLPDTRHLHDANRGTYYVPQWEEIEIEAVSSTTVTLRRPLAFSHHGARYGDGTPAFLPHVANLTRSIVVRSETPVGTRGHQIFVHRADVDIRWVEFRDLGRTTTDELNSTTFAPNGAVSHVGTNQIGRYPLHPHHLMGPAKPQESGHQFTLIGNAVTHSRKWSIAIHNSHYGLVQGNVLYENQGAALMTEDGSESFNVIDGNFALRTTGKGGRDTHGREASGFYFRGPNNYVRNNVAANILNAEDPDAGYGYKYFFTYLDDILIPASPGKMPSVKKAGTKLPILQFTDNEVYGATESGLTYWWVGTYGNNPVAGMPQSVFRNLRIWHVYNKGVFNYPSNQVTFDNLTVLGDPALGSLRGRGFEGGDYLAKDLRITNARIESMGIGIVPSTLGWNTTQLIQNPRLRNGINLEIIMLTTSSAESDWIPARSIVVSSPLLERPLYENPGTTVRADIRMHYFTEGSVNLVQKDTLTITNYNQVVGDNVQVFYTQQAPTFVMPETSRNPNGSVRLTAAPKAGLTNAQTLALHAIAVAGAVAPCTTTRPHVIGFVCPADAVSPRRDKDGR